MSVEEQTVNLLHSERYQMKDSDAFTMFGSAFVGRSVTRFFLCSG